MKIDRILDEYQNGDADERLALFLYHRELREEFDRIDQYDPLDFFWDRRTAWPVPLMRPGSGHWNAQS
jgi:hypothetical protein